MIVPFSSPTRSGFIVPFGHPSTAATPKASSAVVEVATVVGATEAVAVEAVAEAATSELRIALVLSLAPPHRLSARRDCVSAAVVRRHSCEHWLALSGTALERREQPGLGLYARLCGAPLPSAEVVEQIELDIARTNVGEGEVEARRAVLRRVLLAWAKHDPDAGYVQGMDAIAVAALLPSACASLGPEAEEAAFWWLRHAVCSVLEGFYAPGMGGLWAELGCLRRAISVAHPRLAAHLDSLGVDVAIIGPSWYLTLFTRILPRAEVARALAALAARTLAPTHLALGVLLACREALLAAQSFDAAVHALCGNICASRARRAPAGVLARATEAAALLPHAALAAIRTAECKASASEASASECGSARAPSAKRTRQPH